MKLDFDFNTDYNIDDFSDLDLNLDIEFETRYIKPPKSKGSKNVKYSNAKNLSKEINQLESYNYNIIVNGSFIFGDFIEAFIAENLLSVKELTLSTLSLNQDNVDSLRNLLDWGLVDCLNLITSGYFYSHEKYNLLPYIYQKLDIDNKFQYAAADSHCKIYLIHLNSGEKIVIQGSVNLRSSDNIEQFTMQQSDIDYDFYYDYQIRILEKYKTINKTVRGKKHINEVLNLKK